MTFQNPMFPEPHPDAELLVLGVEYDAAFAALFADGIENDEPAFQIACDRRIEIADRVCKSSASTLEGLAEKARVLLNEIRDVYGSDDEVQEYGAIAAISLCGWIAELAGRNEGGRAPAAPPRVAS